MSSASSSSQSNEQDHSAIRIRHEWSDWGDTGRSLFADAVETAIEWKLHQRFVAYHADRTSNVQAHETSAFFAWHRVFCTAYESMLRSLEPRFSNLALPYWDVRRDVSMAMDASSSSSSSCRSYATCSRIVKDLGGIIDNGKFHVRSFLNREVEGVWHHRSPIQNLRDDNNMVGIVRHDLWSDPLPLILKEDWWR